MSNASEAELEPELELEEEIDGWRPKKRNKRVLEHDSESEESEKGEGVKEAAEGDMDLPEDSDSIHVPTDDSQSSGSPVSHTSEQMAEHGYKLEAFNTKIQEEPELDDQWMAGITKGEMRAARNAQKKQVQKRKREMTNEDKYLVILDILNSDETPLEALARLGAEKKTCKEQEKLKVTQNIESLTDALQLDIADAYNLPREWYARAAKQDTASSKKSKQSKQPFTHKQYQYKYKHDTETNGPYFKDTMQEWFNEGYFGQDGRDVLIRAYPAGVWREVVSGDEDEST